MHLTDQQLKVQDNDGIINEQSLQNNCSEQLLNTFNLFIVWVPFQKLLKVAKSILKTTNVLLGSMFEKKFQSVI